MRFLQIANANRNKFANSTVDVQPLARVDFFYDVALHSNIATFENVLRNLGFRIVFEGYPFGHLICREGISK
jgi:hypothetical protein